MSTTKKGTIEMITQSELKELFDYRNGMLYWKVDRGNNQCKGKRAGCTSNRGYRDVVLDNKHYREHRLIFLIHHGKLPKCIDHINGDVTDNRIENLRETSLAQNQHNRKLGVDNKSGKKGVSWHKVAKKWVVQLQVNGKKMYLGVFDDVELAELVSDEARDKHHGKYARYG